MELEAFLRIAALVGSMVGVRCGYKVARCSVSKYTLMM
jgi:hypothetical protein